MGRQDAARFASQGCSQASQWLQEACPGGKAHPDPTWRTMMRARLLQRAPGAPEVPTSGRVCQHVRASGGTCGHSLDTDNAHEHYCGTGGGALQRHNRVLAWLANKIREYWLCAVREERATSADVQGRPGRMDITARRPEGTLEVDVTIASSASIDQAELLRRIRDPGRAARLEIKKKLRRYGPSVLAFALEDTGRMSTGTCRLLRELARGQDEVEENELYQTLVREVQHIVLANSASMLQAARGQPRTL